MAAPQAAGYGAGAGLTSVVPDGQGFYRATFANGNTVRLGGQTGQKLYDQQQAAIALSQPRDQPTAPEQVAPAPAPSRPGERVGSTVVGAPRGGQAEPAAAPEAEQTGPVKLGYTMKAIDPATGKEFEGEAIRQQDGSIGVFRAPTRGSPGGLTALGKQTMAQYAQAAVASGEHSAKAAEAQQIGVDIAVQDAEARQAFIQKQQELNLLEQHRQQDEERELQEKVSNLNAKYDLARQTFADARADPTRIGRGGKKWLFGLSAALGAFGAGLARTPNFAMDFINARVADDIRSQEAEINVKGRDADNQLATLTRSLGDLKLAKTAYRQLKLEEASLEGQRIAGQFKGQAIAANAMMVAEQAAAEGIKVGEQRSREFVEHVMKEKLYYRQGSAGSAGGIFSPQLGQIQAGQNLEKGRFELAKDKQALEKGAREEATKGKGLNANTAARVAQIDASLAALDRYKQMHTEMGKPGVLVEGGSWASDDSQKLAGQAVGLGPLVAKAIEGDAATKESMDNVRSALLNSSGDQIEKSVKAMQQVLIDQREALLAQPAAPDPVPQPPQ